ncbi:MAG: mechanosensitive ion channel [bacterium]
MISGLFLLGERPFVVGDTLQINDTVGEVVSIDLLSVTIRTFDNLAVRVPNETLLKTTFSEPDAFLPIRPLDILLGVAYREDRACA